MDWKSLDKASRMLFFDGSFPKIFPTRRKGRDKTYPTSLSSHFHGTAREEQDTQAAGRNNEKNIGGIAGLVVQLPDYYSGSTPVILNSESIQSGCIHFLLFRKIFRFSIIDLVSITTCNYIYKVSCNFFKKIKERRKIRIILSYTALIEGYQCSVKIWNWYIN